jgi:hypothetical protein
MNSTHIASVLAQVALTILKSASRPGCTRRQTANATGSEPSPA